MVESEDEFTELCSKLLKRVKKSKPLEGQSTSTASTAAKSRSKRPKPSGAKNKAGNGASREAEESSKAGGVPEKPNDGNGAEQSCAVPVPVPVPMPQPSRHTEIDVHAKESQEEITGLPEQPSVKDCVLERMRQFKRTSPIRMKLNSVEVHEEHVKTFKVNSDVHTDGDLAVAVQIDLKEQQPVSLEDEGLFFCQLCQKDLTSMSSRLREQHVNRHPLVKKLWQLKDADQDLAKLLLEQIYENAMIAAGLNDDPRPMVGRLNELLVKALEKH